MNEIPVYAASYVLDSYGYGAVMGVPAHDEWDKEFADMNNLPSIKVIEEDIVINSLDYSNMKIKDFVSKLYEKGYSKWKIEYWM